MLKVMKVMMLDVWPMKMEVHVALHFQTTGTVASDSNSSFRNIQVIVQNFNPREKLMTAWNMSRINSPPVNSETFDTRSIFVNS